MSDSSKRRLNRAEKWLFASPLVLLFFVGGGWWLRSALTLRLHDIAWAPDGTIWSAYRDTSVSVRDARTGRVLRTLGTERSANSLSFALSPDGKKVAMQGASPMHIEVRDTRDESLLFRAKTGFFSHPQWSLDNTLLSFSDGSGTTYLNATTGKTRTLGGGSFGVNSALRNRNTEFTALNKSELQLDKIGVRDTRSGRWLQIWKRGGPGLSCLAASRDGKFVAASSTSSLYQTGVPPQGIALFDARRGRFLRFCQGQGTFWRLSFSPDGTRLAASPHQSADVRVWDVATGRELFRVRHRAVHGFNPDNTVSFAWSPDGNSLATASADDTLMLWNWHTGREKSFSP